jgi:hypothetical protein
LENALPYWNVSFKVTQEIALTDKVLPFIKAHNKSAG